MSLSTAKMTSKQFLMLGEDPPGVRLELAHGDIVVSPSPSPGHSRLCVQLTRILSTYIEENQLGELFTDTDTIFDDDNTRRPDLLYFSTRRLHLVGEKAIRGAPDLCIEILSPTSVEIDRHDKYALYEKRRVAHYWIVDPAARTIEAFSLKRRKFVLAATASGSGVARLPPFPDLDLPLAQLWPRR